MKKFFVINNLGVCVCVVQTSTLLTVHQSLHMSAEHRGANSSSSNSDSCFPSGPLTGWVRSPAQRAVAAVTAAKAGAGPRTSS